MDTIGQRVAARYQQKIAESIGNPEDLIRAFERGVTNFADMEPLIPEMERAMKNLETCSGPQCDEDRTFVRQNEYRFVAKTTVSFQFLQVPGSQLFLALLQQYELSGNLRKVIEQSAKFWAKIRVQRAAKGKEVETYKKHLALYRSQLEAAKAALKSPVRGQGGEIDPTLKVGPFRVINTGEFPPETMETISKVVEKAHHLLTSKGLGKVCYGDVLVSNTLARPNVLAFYLTDKDEFFIRANLKGKETNAVQTLIHELAHRLQFKFMKSKEAEIKSIYTKLTWKERDRDRAVLSDPALKPQPGETLPYKGETLVVTKVVYDTVHLTIPDEPNSKLSMPLRTWLKVKGIDTSNHGGGSSFITPYAATNFEENFAEMVSYYCLGKLPRDQEEMLEAIL